MQQTHRTLADFPTAMAARAQLDTLAAQLQAAEFELADAEQLEAAEGRGATQHHAEAAEADALLAGVAVAEQPAVNLETLRKRVRVLTAARDKHKRVVDQLAAAAEREVAAEDREADDADAAAIVHHLQSAMDARERRTQRRASLHTRFGSCSLPSLDLDQDFARRLPHALQQFRDGAKHLGVDVDV